MLRAGTHSAECTRALYIGYNGPNDAHWCTADYAWRSKNFIVGLISVSPVDSKPTLWNYTLCGQYPGDVPSGATVSLYCPYNLPPFRYVIVQFPITANYMNFCELEVIAPGK